MFASDADDQAGCGIGRLRLVTGGIGHRAMARDFSGECTETAGVYLGPDEGDPKGGEGRRQRRFLAVHVRIAALAGKVMPPAA